MLITSYTVATVDAYFSIQERPLFSNSVVDAKAAEYDTVV